MVVESVSLSSEHRFVKRVASSITLLAGLGVEGDAHLGRTVKHRSRVRRDPTQPNLRQVHLLHGELLDELNEAGYNLGPGMIGENITTRGLALLDLSTGTKLVLGDSAVVEITGLRNPCAQLDEFRPGLMQAVLEKDSDGGLVRKAGVMAVVRVGGVVSPGDEIRVSFLPKEFKPLKPV